MLYQIKVTETELYGFQVEAESKKEALEKATVMAQEMTKEQKDVWWYDCDGDIEVTDD